MVPAFANPRKSPRHQQPAVVHFSQSVQCCQRSASSSPERRCERTPPPLSTRDSRKERRVLGEVDGDCGYSQATQPLQLAAGEPSLCRDKGKRVLEQLQGMLCELQEGQARVEAVHDKTKIMR